MKATIHFSKIKEEIIGRLQQAQHSVKIAVAWFTDEDIIRVLAQKQASGVHVQTVISNAKENFENVYNFKEYLHAKAELFVSNGKFLHHKFCIIDGSVIINGSYNWSYAARWNEENILVLLLEHGNKQDHDVLKRFEVKYHYLSTRNFIKLPDIAAVKAFAHHTEDAAKIQSQRDENEIRLRQQFENDLRAGLEKSKAANIPPTPHFLERMERDGGGVEFVKRILRDEMNSGEMKSGFRKLEELIPHRVDLSLEYLASRPQYESLFTKEELEFCRKLMAKYHL